MSVPRTDPPRSALTQNDLPFVAHIRDLRDRDVGIYHSTGHKLGAAASPEILDLLGPEVFASSPWINAPAYRNAARDAETLAAAAWNSDRSFYLVDGSSSGNHALFLAALRPGDTVIVSRDLHWSMLVALIKCGARPVYVVPRLHPELDISLGVAPEDVAAALDAHPEARLVAIVSPSFCGVASDLRAIAEISHGRDVALFVDEAWGAHNHFHPALPASAMDSGADAAVSSVHKTLPALSQGSILHMRDARLSAQRVSQAVYMTQNTSPSYVIMATLDAARRQMALHGEELLERTIALSLDARRRLARIPGLDVIDAARLGLDDRFHDATKLVVDVHALGVSGFEVNRLLAERFDIALEMGDHRGVVGNFSTGDRPEDIDRLVAAMEALVEQVRATSPASCPWRSSGAALQPAPQAMTPREAFFSETEEVPLRDAVGRVIADLVTPYPPGIPILVPGEVITAEKAAYLVDLERHGQGTYGTLAERDGMVQVVRDA